VSSSELEARFFAFGTVRSAQVIEDRDNGGRSKGFAFVEMGDDQDAQAAIQGLNGKEHDGRILTVNEARPREERGGGRSRPTMLICQVPRNGFLCNYAVQTIWFYMTF